VTEIRRKVGRSSHRVARITTVLGAPHTELQAGKRAAADGSLTVWELPGRRACVPDAARSTAAQVGRSVPVQASESAS
jgi:hypothetical protein